ncbi:hypothetical protein CEK25_012550 [Fusarium fujikuroi]|nr:hypothetical protein CEK25_012550 [Fusarium fujikuroi]
MSRPQVRHTKHVITRYADADQRVFTQDKVCRPPRVQITPIFDRPKRVGITPILSDPNTGFKQYLLLHGDQAVDESGF